MVNYYQISLKDFEEILKTLLREKMVDKIISGVEKRRHYTINPKTITDEKDVEGFPFSQLFVYGYSRTNSASKVLHKEGGALDEKIAMIGHPCDGRALIELSKKIQVNLDNVFTIIMEDIGCVSTSDMKKFLKKEKIKDEDLIDEFLTPDKLLLKMQDGSVKEYKLGDKIDVTPNCNRCFRKKLDDGYDLSVTWLTLEPFSKQLILKSNSAKGNEVLKKSKIELKELPKNKIEGLSSLQEEIMSKAEQRRAKELKEWLEKPDRIKEIAKCTMCGVCITACPVCFCKDCILKNNVRKRQLIKLHIN
ncbi:MAG: hypothetical protein GF364_21265 [Candidatus Lokiarchaeota archaeon]|nr:hypothetical protein [Candidatus Lokiarchaeota archaeon]